MKRKLIIYCFIIAISIVFQSCNHRQHHESNRRIKTANRNIGLNSTGKTIIKMKKQSGVYYVPCKINGSEMEFIFDTGASDITMSLTEALFLYKQGKLANDDFIGTQQYQIANGAIEEGTVVILKTVTIGNRVLYNVQASIVHNMQSPLLLGQSALSKFGKISIDYKEETIIFE